MSDPPTTPAARRPRRGRGGLFGLAVAAAYLAGFACYVLVWVADPLALRPYGIHAALSPLAYRDHVAPLLFPTAAKDGTDLVVIGGSASSGFMPAMLRAAYPGARRVANLSFEGVSAEDMEAELGRLQASPSLKHVILSLEWTLIKDTPTFGRVAGRPPYDAAWSNPVPEFDADAMRVLVHEARTGVLGGPDWFDPSQDQPDFLIGQPSMASPPERVAELRRAVDAARPWVTAGPPLGCAAMPNLQRVMDQLRALAARGVSVDVLFPPYALSFYSEPTDLPGQRFVAAAFPRHGEIFTAMVALRRCAVAETTGVPGLRVFAFDTDRSITADLSQYRDGGHLLPAHAYRQILARMARGDGVLTVAAWPGFEAQLTQEVQSYEP